MVFGGMQARSAKACMGRKENVQSNQTVDKSKHGDTSNMLKNLCRNGGSHVSIRSKDFVGGV